MKKLSLVSALVLGGLVACSITANAQQDQGGKKGDKGGGHWTVEQRLEKMTTNLNLTDEQKPKVKAVLEDCSKKMKELDIENVPKEQRREKMQPIRDEETKQLKEILTSEQFEKCQKMQEERRSHMGGEKKKTDQ
jgi:periplasmic protein CpxP/Spy